MQSRVLKNYNDLVEENPNGPAGSAPSNKQFSQASGSPAKPPGQPSGPAPFVQIPLELLDYDISPAAFKLYAVLLGYARRFEACWPSHKTLANDMHLKPRRVIELLKELEEAKLITIESRAAEGESNIYRLHKLASGHPSSEKLPKRSDPSALNDMGGTQRSAYPGMQKKTDKLHEVEKHEQKVHEHTPVDVSYPLKGPEKENVCEQKDRGDMYSGPNTKSGTQITPVESKGSETGNSPTLIPVTVMSKEDKTSAGGQAQGAGPITAGNSHINQNKPGSSSTQQGREEVLAASSPLQSVRSRLDSALKGYGISGTRARSLAAKLEAAQLNQDYVQGWAGWIEAQSVIRTINNPAGFLVQMLDQLAPLPSSAESRSGTRSETTGPDPNLALKHLTKLIEIERRNLAEARNERDRQQAQAKLEKYLAQQVGLAKNATATAG